jgi:hypothetical protein
MVPLPLILIIGIFELEFVVTLHFIIKRKPLSSFRSMTPTDLNLEKQPVGEL